MVLELHLSGMYVIQVLGVKNFVAKFVPWLLLPEQKEHRAAVANDFIQTPTNEPTTRNTSDKSS